MRGSVHARGEQGDPGRLRARPRRRATCARAGVTCGASRRRSGSPCSPRAYVLAVLALAAALLATDTAGAVVLRQLPGSVPQAVAGMEAVGPAPRDLRLEHVIVFLGLRDREGLTALVAAQQDRRTPRFRRWLDADEIADRFGARRDDYERARDWFVAHGLEIVGDSRFRTHFVVAGTAATIETALAAPIGLFRERGSRDGRLRHAPTAEPALPESLAGAVRGIVGLDDLPAYRPLVTLMDGDTALAPNDFAAAYQVLPLQAAGLTGAGHSIAVVARSNFSDSDIASFSARFLPTPLAPRRVFKDNNSRLDPGILPDEGERIEVLLDTQWAGALAPGAALNVMIGSRDGNIPEALETAINNRTAGLPSGDIISISFGLCEPAAPPIVTELFDAFYAIANAQGQTVLVASGDSGASDCLPERAGLAVSGLASSSHAVAIGGTSFLLDPSGVVPAVIDETTWNDGAGASGGGRSSILGMPFFQVGAGLTPLSSSRVLPDVALAGSPRTPGYVIVQDGAERVVGGTSAGVPAFASVLALVNENVARTLGLGGGLGQLLPDLYRLGSEQSRGLRAPVFRDVIAGDNGGFAAGPGFDLATGWGAPLGDALAAAVTGPGRCQPLIDAVHPEAGCLVPSSRGRRGCAGEWLVEQDVFALQRGLPAVHQSCRDGDPQCDSDGIADGTCTLRVALCVNVFDFRILVARGKNRGLPRCRPKKVRRVRVLSPSTREARRDPLAAANREALVAALGGLPDFPTSLVNTCTTTVPVRVSAGTSLTLRARVSGSRGAAAPRVVLGCGGP